MEQKTFSSFLQAPTSQLMTSALIHVYNSKNQWIRGRALLDTCSSANFITEDFATSLGLPRKKCSIPVGALDDLNTITKHITQLTFKSIHNSFQKTIMCLTVPDISKLVPSEPIPRETIDIPSNLPLADPNFYKPAPVDLLIGAGPTLSMFCIGQIDLSNRGEDLCLQKTRLGWVIGGSPGNSQTHMREIKCHLSDLHNSINRFWEIEEVRTHRKFSEEELKCEKHFQHHVTRDKSGRYIVALPFKNDKLVLGESRPKAQKRLQSLLNKFNKEPNLRKRYTEVINEYKQLGHMTEIIDVNHECGFYLPHHAVIKDSSISTKLRVVFDGSAKTSTGSSLNDNLLVGPTIQDDIVSLILKFRLHNYVITADIEKMYRQVLVRSEDRKYQRVLWEEAENIKTYELNTVTFGLASAPFLAIRCLHQLAEDEGHKFLIASNILKNDLYVDNLLTGANTIEETIQIRDEITQLLKLGGFNLRQWGSNEPLILRGLEEDSIIPNFQLDKDQPLKTLGIVWNAKTDCITYTTKPVAIDFINSKRKILSEIAKIFDPLGLLGPIILHAKKIMQRLWQLRLDWDESVPNSVFTSWMEFCTQLPLINNLSFDRRITIDDAINVQLHGFCDASESGYGACIYLRSTDSKNQIYSKLLFAKSRVAPLKTISLPRLELCGAQLLSQLVTQIKSTLKISFEKTVLWTDSTIALHWIQTPPHILKTFVANRVADIQSHSDSEQWRHVRSADNPADAISRGQLPQEFVKNSLWVNGPHWIRQKESDWPKFNLKTLNELPEAKKIVCLITATSNVNILQRYSSFNKLKRVIAYCMRFKFQKQYKGLLKVEELKNAEMIIVKLIQTVEFADDIHFLKQGKPIHKKSKLITLNPFLDNDDIMRVGGRINNSTLPYSQQHPILLPHSHFVTHLIIEHYHHQNFHSGVQTTLYTLRRKFWLLDGRNQVRKIIRKCVKCFHTNPSVPKYVMGNLPSVRLTQARPFLNVGVDYCGPFFIKEKKFRNRTRIKVYVAVFICLVVKAIHLEVVSDLTTEGFIAALKRFIARRGKPSSIYSDNGTNFIGANNELRDVYALLNSEVHQQKCDSFLSNQGISWHFIPPLSPHFGGIWESAVKSFKHHVKRVVTDQLFTFEEFNTFAIEIEGILNSRPLTPISSDPNDLLVLTPGHFLTGDALTSLPEVDFRNTPTNRLSNWQHLQKIRQHFWTRWAKEYLNELNIRYKWATGQHVIKEGTVVVLKEDNLPPMKWALGRVIKTHPGEDGIIRTVTVKTMNNELKRNVKKVSPLPIIDNDNLNSS